MLRNYRYLGRSRAARGSDGARCLDTCTLKVGAVGGGELLGNAGAPGDIESHAVHGADGTQRIRGLPVNL